jgi:Spy/CpxP family protein refolding chaperone
MRKFMLVGVVGLALCASGTLWAQVARQPRPAIAPVRVAVFQRGGHLLPPAIVDKLELTAEQKEKLAKLEKEFAEKQQKVQNDLRDLITKARQNGTTPDQKTLRGLSQKISKLRQDYQKKADGLLTKEQQKKVQEARKQPLVRPALARGIFNRPGALFTPYAQRQLNLTDAQKKKLAALQAEMDKKAQEILTKEQQKKFEQLKKQPARGVGAGGIRIVPIRRVPQPKKP